MKKPTRGIAAPPELRLEDAPMSNIIDALAGGQVTATALTKAYRARIAAYDRAGPALNSVRASIPMRSQSQPGSTAPSHQSGGHSRACRSW